MAESERNRATVRVETLKGGRTAYFYLEESPVPSPPGQPWQLLCEVVPARSGAGRGPERVQGGTRDELERHIARLTPTEVEQLVDRIVSRP